MVDPAQFNEIAIANRSGYVVKLRDIGHAEDSYEEPTTAARLNGEPAVTLVVSKQSGENTVATADEVKARLKEIQPLCRKTSTSQIINDQSIFIKAAVDNIKQHLIEGSIFAVDHHFPVPGQHPHHADRGGRDSDVDHLHLRADGRRWASR